jgi:hypothetical protein
MSWFESTGSSIGDSQQRDRDERELQLDDAE